MAVPAGVAAGLDRDRLIDDVDRALRLKLDETVGLHLERLGDRAAGGDRPRDANSRRGHRDAGHEAERREAEDDDGLGALGGCGECPHFWASLVPWPRAWPPMRRGSVPVDSQKAPTRRYILGTSAAYGGLACAAPGLV